MRRVIREVRKQPGIPTDVIVRTFGRASLRSCVRAGLLKINEENEARPIHPDAEISWHV